MHRAKGDRLVRASVLPVCDNMVIINNFLIVRKINTEADPVEDDDGETPRRRNVIHPFKILVGMVTYKSGRGDKSSLMWIPNDKIIKALDVAFYQAFHHVEPTGKKFLLGVDVSGSMSQPCIGSRWVLLYLTFRLL